MMKSFRVLFALLVFILPSMMSSAFAIGSWASVSTQTTTVWDQVQEVSQKTRVTTWGGQVINAGNPVSRCRRICRRDCEQIISEICYGDGTCRTVIKFLCNTFCDILCDDLYP